MMVQLKKISLLVLMALFIQNGVNAKDIDSSGINLGIKLGQVDFGLPKNSFAYGFSGGYQFNKNLGIEAEYLMTDGKEFVTNGIRQDFDGKAYGVYGSYRHFFNSSPIYLKTKLGVAKTELDAMRVRDAKLINATVIQETYSFDKTGLSGGFSIGYETPKGHNFEIGYDYFNKYTDGFNLGLNYGF